MPYVVTIDSKKCGGCGECAINCPAKLFALDGRPIDILAPDIAEEPGAVAIVGGGAADCTGCMSCTAVCVSECIVLQEV